MKLLGWQNCGKFAFLGIEESCYPSTLQLSRIFTSNLTSCCHQIQFPGNFNIMQVTTWPFPLLNMSFWYFSGLAGLCLFERRMKAFLKCRDWFLFRTLELASFRKKRTLELVAVMEGQELCALGETVIFSPPFFYFLPLLPSCIQFFL